MIFQQYPICALATASGVGAIAVVRVSGLGAIEIVNTIFKGKNLINVESQTVHFGTIMNGDETIDEVLATVFKSPKSFTKEDVVEISCHGSNYIIQQILQLLVRNGASLAKAGEFTQRAFLNGQFDLVQAEAVADLIAADSAANHRVAINQLRGGFSKQLAALREELIHFASLVELELDFGEEDVEFAERDDLKALILKLQQSIEPLIDSFQYGNAIKEGVPVAIIGAPNVGKSTLLNALLNEERAIVTPIAGTTRDVIEDILVIDGIKFRIIDTAGIRETQDLVESIGIERSKQAIEKAEVVLMVYDSDETLSEISNLATDKKIIWVRNKADILEGSQQSAVGSQQSVVGGQQSVIGGQQSAVDSRQSAVGSRQSAISSPTSTVHSPQSVSVQSLNISAKNGIGIEDLKRNLTSSIINLKSSIVVTNLRHYEHLQKTNEALGSVLTGLESGITGDFLAQDIRLSLFHLGELTGTIVSDDLLANIFSKFCIGK